MGSACLATLSWIQSFTKKSAERGIKARRVLQASGCRVMIAFDPSAVSRASLPENSKFLPSKELSRKLPERGAITTTWGVRAA